MEYKKRYNEAHREWFKVKYPSAYADGYYFSPKMPKVATANGLTQFIVNYIDWIGYHANRISSSGRYVPSDNKFDGGMFIPGTTKKGTADISSIIAGRAVMWEVKVGRDRPSPAQIKMQEQVTKAGGYYYFVHSPEEFFDLFDALQKK